VNPRESPIVETSPRIAANLHRIRERIAGAAIRSGRNADAVRLIAVTKTVSVERVREAAAAGALDMGENRLQEGLAKRGSLHGLPIAWHFIGRIQTNKAKKIAESFDWVHTVDRAAVAEKLDAAAAEKRLPILIGVNLGGEAAKGGASEGELDLLISRVRALSRLDLCGLMTVPPFFENPEGARPIFRRLKQLADAYGLPELSMGMSHDFDAAIEEGATMVRIGTALFGARGAR
jgi:pyridoxal phosphate enzyme (YggS family)